MWRGFRARQCHDLVGGHSRRCLSPEVSNDAAPAASRPPAACPADANRVTVDLENHLTVWQQPQPLTNLDRYRHLSLRRNAHAGLLCRNTFRILTIARHDGARLRARTSIAGFCRRDVGNVGVRARCSSLAGQELASTRHETRAPSHAAERRTRCRTWRGAAARRRMRGNAGIWVGRTRCRISRVPGSPVRTTHRSRRPYVPAGASTWKPSSSAPSVKPRSYVTMASSLGGNSSAIPIAT